METTIQQAAALRSGYFNPDVFRKKKRLLPFMRVGFVGTHFLKEWEGKLDELYELLNSFEPGTELVLVREPDNSFDELAVSIRTVDGRKLGYVTRFKVEPLARLMDRGRVFRAYVEKNPSPFDEPEHRCERWMGKEGLWQKVSIYLEE